MMFTLTLFDTWIDVQQEGRSACLRSLNGYATEYDPDDAMHAFLDRLESHVVRALASGEQVSIEASTCPAAYAACEALFAAPVAVESPLEILIKGLLQ